MDLAQKLAKVLKKTNLPEEAVLFLVEKGCALVEEEKADRRAFAEELERMTDDELRRFVPDVYQKNIYKIDYRKLKEQGIRLISFDIDDTINDVLFNNLQARIPGGKLTMSADARDLFRELKEMGFTVTLLTNAHTKIAQDTCEDLQADGYIARADKPDTRNFLRMMERYGAEPSQTAHVGNSMRQDIAGGNLAGVTTCLVRRAGVSMKAGKFFLKTAGLKTKGHLVRKRLLERGLWRKHHKDCKGDQYYQLGEMPGYREED